jgi:hypothetical protein
LVAWFAVSIGILATAAALALLAFIAARLRRKQMTSRLPMVLFWTATFVLAVAATTALGHGRQQFVWTWPLALFVVYQATIQTIVWAEGSAAKKRARWWSRGMVIIFLSFCWLYYAACQQLGLATVWAFLIGFLPAWPLAVAAARRRGKPCQSVLLVGLAFSLFYWSGGAFIGWKTAVAEVWEHL